MFFFCYTLYMGFLLCKLIFGLHSPSLFSFLFPSPHFLSPSLSLFHSLVDMIITLKYVDIKIKY